MKKLITLFVVLVCAGSVYAYDCVIDGIKYDLNKKYKTAAVTNKERWDQRYSTSITIPATITYKGQTYSVTEIEEYAFSGYAADVASSFFSALIPITSTNNDNSSNRTSVLTAVTIPYTVTTIGSNAFLNCVIGDLYCSQSVSLANVRANVERLHRLTNAELALTGPFPIYAQLYVESQINEWQKKGEFEKTSDWQKRVTEETRQEKVDILVKEAENNYLSFYSKQQVLNVLLGVYDTDNEVYLITESQLGSLLVPVPIDEAPYVKQNWYSCTTTPHYAFAGTDIVVQSIDFAFPNGKTYTYQSNQDLTYAQADIQYNFDPIELNLGSNTSVSQSKGQQTILQKQLTIGKSDVDVDIPQTGKSCSNTFAVIISNENYTQLKEVPCAINDGKVFAQYCEKTIGLPKDNIKLYTNATYGMMIEAIRTMKNIAKAYEGDINIIFYYSGHGAPTDDTKEAYLLPVDAFGVAPEVCYSLNKLYKELADMNAKSVTMFLDACFSGATKDGDMLASVRGVAIKAKANAPVGNMVVFSAASDEQTALPYLDMGHGLFTYYVLKKLQDSKGDVTYQELGDYVKQEVYRRSSVVGKVQTPTVSASTTAEGWQNWKLK